MDSFQKCRAAFEKASWSYEDSVADLTFDFSKRFLPLRLCGQNAPSWMSSSQRQMLNHIRGFSYAHIFYFVEEFIIEQTCATATEYVHVNRDAVSAILKFADEETKHQRLFAQMKDTLIAGLGFRPGEIPNQEGVAREICQNSDFAVYLLCLVLEWMTQRHYLECFQEEENDLDPGFVKVFRLHWTEEAQHARLDAVLIEEMAAEMEPQAIAASIAEFSVLLKTLDDLLAQQSVLDLQSFESACGPLPQARRAELLSLLSAEWRWTFITSGLEHKSFKSVYEKSVSNGKDSLARVVAEALTEHGSEPAVTV